MCILYYINLNDVHNFMFMFVSGFFMLCKNSFFFLQKTCFDQKKNLWFASVRLPELFFDYSDIKQIQLCIKGLCNKKDVILLLT